MVVFALDLVTPLGVAAGVPYVIVVLVCLWSPARHDAVAAAAVCSILTIAGFFASPHGSDAWSAISNRLLALLAIWITALLVARRKHDLREHRAHLEELVMRRTAELTHVNAQLVEEVHDRKLAVEALEASEEKFRDLFEHSSNLIQSVTPDGSFLYVNPAWKKALGYNDDEVANLNLFDVIHPDSLPHCRDLFSRLVTGEDIEHVEAQFMTKDGRTIIVEGNSSCRFENGIPVATRGTFHDVTHRKQTEESFARQAADLARSNAELERFAYAASHDLQEPLRAVAGHCRLLQQRYAGRLDPDADELLEYAVDGATRMKALIDGLLAYSRVRTRDMAITPTDCEQVLDEAIANLKVSIDDTGATITRDPMPRVAADNTQLIELFQNLISNAIKYRDDRPPTVHVGAEARNGMWVFSVRDQGIGIAPEHLERIFEVFQRLHTHDQYPGSGVGLAICNRIVERMGGTIWVDSHVGRGSTFYFELPSWKDRA